MSKSNLTRTQLATMTTYSLPAFDTYEWKIVDEGDQNRFIELLELAEVGELLASELITLLSLTDQSGNQKKWGVNDWQARSTNALRDIAESGPFTIQETADIDHLSILVDGLGSVIINRSGEGVMIDIYDNDQESTSCIASLALLDEDFQPEGNDTP